MQPINNFKGKSFDCNFSKDSNAVIFFLTLLYLVILVKLKISQISIYLVYSLSGFKGRIINVILTNKLLFLHVMS